MAGNKKKIIRATTVPMSLTSFCTGLLKELSEQYEVIALSSPGKELEQIHNTDGVRTIAVPMERHISLTKDIIALFRMIRVFMKEKPYMVHSMTPKAGLLCMMAAWICRVPRRVHTFTGLVWPTTTGVKRSILMLTDKILCLCATHIIPEGQGVLQDLQAHITKKPMKVLGYGNVRGVDINYWDKTESVKEEGHKLRCRYGIDHEFTFLYVGRIVKDKGINELVEAFNELYSSHPESRLLLVGSKEDNLDPISEKSKEIIEHLPSIIMTGPVFGRDLVNYYSAADCFVLPSYREGFPNTPIEAGAMGLPCIVTDINGSREIIEDGNNGIIVPSKDSSALCKAMTNLLENKYLCNSLAENARPMIVSRFEQGFVRKCLYDFYNEIM